jgi:MFS family permease
MNTTNLFVELIVIGAGVIGWLLLLVVSLFGWKWVPIEQVFSTTALLPLLSLVYVLGIVADRIADTLFEYLWNDRLRREWFPNIDDYHNARREVLTGSERLSELLEYGRSRLRICRGWALNSVLIAAALNLFVWLRLAGTPAALPLSIFGTILFLLFAAACSYTWRKLTLTEYRKVKEQAAFLVEAREKRG